MSKRYVGKHRKERDQPPRKQLSGKETGSTVQKSKKTRRTDIKRMKKWRWAIAWFIFALSVCIMVLAGSKLWETWQTYREGNRSYEQLAEQVRLSESPVFPESDANTGVEIPDLSIDFSALREINPDAVAWLYCPDTAIDYPLMQARDYDYYLHHLPDGSRNANGSLFIDYNCAPDFTDKLTVVYGHHMKSGRMFGSLVKYKGQTYFEQHPYMYLYTEKGNYRVELMYGCVIGAGEWRDRGFMYKENVDALLAYAAHNTTFASDVKYNKGDRVVALSTCSYEFDDARYVVIGILR